MDLLSFDVLYPLLILARAGALLAGTWIAIESVIENTDRDRAITAYYLTFSILNVACIFLGWDRLYLHSILAEITGYFHPWVFKWQLLEYSVAVFLLTVLAGYLSSFIIRAFFLFVIIYTLFTDDGNRYPEADYFWYKGGGCLYFLTASVLFTQWDRALLPPLLVDVLFLINGLVLVWGLLMLGVYLLHGLYGWYRRTFYWYLGKKVKLLPSGKYRSRYGIYVPLSQYTGDEADTALVSQEIFDDMIAEDRKVRDLLATIDAKYSRNTSREPDPRPHYTAALKRYREHEWDDYTASCHDLIEWIRVKLILASLGKYREPDMATGEQDTFMNDLRSDLEETVEKIVKKCADDLAYCALWFQPRTLDMEAVIFDLIESCSLSLVRLLRLEHVAVVVAACLAIQQRTMTIRFDRLPDETLEETTFRIDQHLWRLETERAKTLELKSAGDGKRSVTAVKKSALMTTLLDARGTRQKYPKRETVKIYLLASLTVQEVFGGDAGLVKALADRDHQWSSLFTVFKNHYGHLNFLYDTAFKHGFNLASGQSHGFSSMNSYKEIEETLWSFTVMDQRVVTTGNSPETFVLLRISDGHPDVILLLVHLAGDGEPSLYASSVSKTSSLAGCYTLKDLENHYGWDIEQVITRSKNEKQGSPTLEKQVMLDTGNEKNRTPAALQKQELVHGTVTVRNDGRISIPRTIRDELAITGKISAFLSFNKLNTSLSFSLEKPGNVAANPITITSDFSFSVPDDWRELIDLSPGTKVVFTAVKRNGKDQTVTIIKDLPFTTKERLTIESAVYHATGGMTANKLRVLLSLPEITPDPSKALVHARKRIRKKQGDLIIPTGRSGNEVRTCLGITAGTTYVYLKMVKHASSGYPLLQLFPSRPNGTTSTKTALSKDFRFVVPPDWLKDLSLFPGEEADIVVYRGEHGSIFAIITPAATATYQTALMYPVPSLQVKKPRKRDTSIKTGKLWQDPPPTIAELKKDKKKLFPVDPATGKPLIDPATDKLLNKEQVDDYLDNKHEVISLIDNLCQQVTATCAANIDPVIQFFSDGDVSGQGTGVTSTINQLLGDQSNLNQAISLVLAGKAQGYIDSAIKLAGNRSDRKISRDKKKKKETIRNGKKKKGKKGKEAVDYTVDSLSSWFAGHTDKWTEFLLFASSPRTYTSLARQWGVSRTFTRQFLHGIRSRLDKHLPKALQLGQPLPPFTEQGIIDACQLLEQRVSQTIADYLKAGTDATSSLYFRNQVITIKENASEITVYLNGFELPEDKKVDPISIGWNPLKERSKAIATHILNEKNAEYKYHSALRAVLSLAAVDNIYPLAVTLQGSGVEVMTPERCLVKPFKSEKRNNTSSHYYRNYSKLQPLNLVMGSSQVVYRPGKALVLTALFHQNGVIEMQVPRYSGNRKPLVFYLPATPAMLQAIERGARVQMIRLYPPEGPSRKVKADIILNGPSWAFASTKHLELEYFCPKCFAKLPPRSTCHRCKIPVVPAKLPEDTHLGIDLNQVGEYMVALSTGDLLSAESQLSLLTLDTAKHHANAKEELSKQQKALANREKRLASVLSTLIPNTTPDQLNQLLSLTASGMNIHPFKDFIKSLGITGKHRASLTALGYNILAINNQITLLHVRIKKLRKALHDLTTREIAVQLLLTGATTLACENLESMDVTGKKGAVAIATLNMPDELAVIVRAVRNINALYRALGIPLEVVIDPVDPHGTSTTHAGCGGKLQRSLASWDMAKCQKCGQTVNTHVSAALNVKFLSQGKPLVPITAPVPPSSPPSPPTKNIPPSVP
ncbi:MAG: hypothetical protein ACFFD4_21675 [Candidatus Odinarchaeota archaeon]